MPPAPSRPPWRRRRWLWLAAGAVLLGLWLARSALLGPVVARLAAATVAEATGGQARIARASGGWLGDAQLHGIDLAGAGWSVRVRRIEADYGLGLLSGKVSALHAITISGVEADIDLEALPHTDARPPWPAVLARLPASLPRWRLDGDGVLRVAGHELRIAGLEVAIAYGLAELRNRSVIVDGRPYALPVIRLRRQTRETLCLDQPIDLPFPGLRCEHLELTLGETVQQLTADGRLAGGTWQARVAAGAVSVEVRGVDAVALGLLPPVLGPVLVDARIERTAGGWAVHALHVAAAGVVLDASAQVEAGPWRCRDLAATLSVDLARLRPGLQGRIQATLRGDLPLDRQQWPQGRLELAVTGADLAVGGKPGAPLRLEAGLDAGVIRLRALEGGWSGWDAQLAADPGVEAGAPADGWRLLPRPISIAGGIVTLAAHGDAAGAIAGELRLDSLPLAHLPLTTGLRHLQGVASGSLRFSGTLAAPTWTGELQLAGVEAKLSADVPTFTAGRARIVVEPGLLTVAELRGDLGGAELSVSGRVRLRGGDEAIALTCRGSNLLLVQRQDARVRADIDLRLSGSFAAPLLSGEVLVGSALITPDLQADGASSGLVDDRIVLFELPDPPLSTLRFAVQVRSTTDTAADRGVRVVTRWGRGTCDLDLRLGGTGALPAPEGRVSVRDGIATLPFSTLKVTHGELVFPPGDPFQPRLTATAGARIRTYDVQAQVTGTLSQPVIRVTGSGLDEQEALMLLTTGSTPRELADPQSQKAALGRVGVWLGQEAWRDLEGLDGVDDGPSLTERLVITWGRERSGQGRDTIDSEVELTEPGSDPAVLLYGERDRYDQYNAGIILRLSWGGEEP